MNSIQIEQAYDKATGGSASKYRRMLMNAPMDVVDFQVGRQRELDIFFNRPESWMQKMAIAVQGERASPIEDMRASIIKAKSK